MFAWWHSHNALVALSELKGGSDDLPCYIVPGSCLPHSPFVRVEDMRHEYVAAFEFDRCAKNRRNEESAKRDVESTHGSAKKGEERGMECLSETAWVIMLRFKGDIPSKDSSTRG
jgi:hypothetical protein